MTEQLQKFLEDSLPQPNTRGSHHSIATVDSYLGDMIINNTGMAFINGVPIRDIMRGLRMKIHQLIGLTVCCFHYSWKFVVAVEVCIYMNERCIIDKKIEKSTKRDETSS